VCLVVIVKTR